MIPYALSLTFQYTELDMIKDGQHPGVLVWRFAVPAKLQSILDGTTTRALLVNHLNSFIWCDEQLHVSGKGDNHQSIATSILDIG